jgi:hypothetical protein
VIEIRNLYTRRPNIMETYEISKSAIPYLDNARNWNILTGEHADAHRIDVRRPKPRTICVFLCLGVRKSVLDNAKAHLGLVQIHRWRKP